MISRRFDELTILEFHDLARLRSEVFVVEQECVYLDLDGRDAEHGTEHHWIETDGAIACYARTLADDGVVRIGRVATAPSARGHGLAGSLMVDLIARYGAATIVLGAQAHLAEWYSRFGFAIDGDEYLEDGIAHVPMRREPVDM